MQLANHLAITIPTCWFFAAGEPSQINHPQLLTQCSWWTYQQIPFLLVDSVQLGNLLASAIPSCLFSAAGEPSHNYHPQFFVSVQLVNLLIMPIPNCWSSAAGQPSCNYNTPRWFSAVWESSRNYNPTCWFSAGGEPSRNYHPHLLIQCSLWTFSHHNYHPKLLIQCSRSTFSQLLFPLVDSVQLGNLLAITIPTCWFNEAGEPSHNYYSHLLIQCSWGTFSQLPSPLVDSVQLVNLLPITTFVSLTKLEFYFNVIGLSDGWRNIDFSKQKLFCQTKLMPIFHCFMC